MTEAKRGDSQGEIEARLMFVSRLDEALRASADAPGVMRIAAELLATRLNASRCAYADVDADSDRFLIRNDYSAPGVSSSAGVYSLNLFGPRAAADMRAGRTLVVRDVAAELPAGEGREMFLSIGIGAIVCCPLVKNGRLVAMMALHQDTPRDWRPDEIALTEAVVERCWAHIERVGAEARLRESDARYRALFDAIDAGFCIIEVLFDGERAVDYRFLEVNPAFASQAGLNDAVGKRMKELAPGHEEHWFELYGRVALTGEAVRFEAEAAALGRWFDVHAFRTEGPERRQVAILFNDISERRRAELALRRSNETLEVRVAEAMAERQLFAEVFETTDAFVQILDPDYRFVALNPATGDEYERAYGVRPKVGDNLLDLLSDRPEQREAVSTVWARALAGEAFDITAQFGDPRYAPRWYAMKFSPLHAPTGELVGASLFGYDVTERRLEQQQLAEAERQRREADALYRAYFENTAEALFVIGVNADGRFTIEELNPAHQAATGLRIDDIRGKPLDEQLPPQVAAAVSERYRRAVSTGRVQSYRETITFDGGVRHWDTVLVPVADAEGRIDRLIGAGRDITAQVQAEEALRQAQKMEAMGQLTGGVAHDFNNLLTPIVGALDMLLRRGVGGEREQRLLANAAQSAERAKTLVQRLLAFARRQPLQPVAVDVARLVGGMAELIASTTGPQIKVVVDAPFDLPPARADANQLEMALLNLSVNARDAMPDGGVMRISAALEDVGSSHAQLRPGRYVRLSVADTGTGMDETTLARAIEPFYSTKGIGKGTGLGLSMVHGLASQLGGALTIQSRPGLGTNVELWLPQAAEQVDEPAQDLADPHPEPERGTALLVDDEDLVRTSTAEMLSDLGYQVVEAMSGEHALSLISGGLEFDLLVTDHLMAGLNGADLTRQVRALRPNALALLISGYAEYEDLDPDLPRLTKPFRQQELAACLAALRGVAGADPSKYG